MIRKVRGEEKKERVASRNQGGRTSWEAAVRVEGDCRQAFGGLSGLLASLGREEGVGLNWFATFSVAHMRRAYYPLSFCLC